MHRLITTLLLCCLCLPVLAEEVIAPLDDGQAKQSTVAMPDPAALSGDWWAYFAAPEAEVERRVNAFTQSLQQIFQAALTSFSAEQVNTAKQRRQALLESLQRYTQFRQVPVDAAQKEIPDLPAETSFADIYRIDALRRQLTQDMEARQDELSRVDSAIETLKRSLDQHRASYVSEVDAARLLRGLLIMRLRVDWELAQEQQRRHKAAQEFLTQRQTELARQAGQAGERLSIAAETLAKIKQERAQLEQRGNALADDAGNAPSPVLAGEGADLNTRIQNQRHLQQRLELELNRARLKLRDLEIALAAYLSGSEGGAETLRNLISDSQIYMEQLKGELKSWRRGSERERMALLREAGAGAAQRQTYATSLDENLANLERLTQTLQRTTALVALSEQRLLAQEGRLVQWRAAGAQSLLQAWNNTRAGFTYTLFELGETPVTALGLLRVLLIITIAWWFSKLVQGGLGRLGERRETISRSSLYALGRMLHYVILAVGFLIGLSSIGVNFTKFALLVSALGVGIGFGLQAMVSNFVSGLIILFERSLKVGDFVDLESGVVGEVKEINIRSTRITTNDNVDVLVPNSEFVNGRVINWTLNDSLRRIHVPFGVAYGTDKDLVKRAVLEAAATVSHTLTGVAGKNPDVWLVGFGDSSLDFELVVWLQPASVKSPSRVSAEYLWAIETALGNYGIEIPFPQRDLHLRSLFGKHDAQALQHIDSMGQTRD